MPEGVMFRFADGGMHHDHSPETRRHHNEFLLHHPVSAPSPSLFFSVVF
jgi:hypothetical protein